MYYRSHPQESPNRRAGGPSFHLSEYSQWELGFEYYLFKDKQIPRDTSIGSILTKMVLQHRDRLGSGGHVSSRR